RALRDRRAQLDRGGGHRGRTGRHGSHASISRQEKAPRATRSKGARMNVDDRIKLGVETLRDRYDGESPDAAFSRRRMLMAAPEANRKRRAKLFMILPLAAAFAASTAWAGATGRITLMVHAIAHSLAPAHPADEQQIPQLPPTPSPALAPSPDPSPTLAP